MTLPSAREMREVAERKAAQREQAQLAQITQALQKAAHDGRRSCSVPGPLRPEIHEALRARGFEISAPRSAGYNETEVDLVW